MIVIEVKLLLLVLVYVRGRLLWSGLVHEHLYLLDPLELGGRRRPKSTLVGPVSKKEVPHNLCKTLSECV
jgi:hypothetical protein